MKERFALLAAYFKEKLAIGKKSGKEKRKSMILSIVALVEVLAIAIVSVSAWVETISTIKLDLNNGTIDNYVFTNANIGYGDSYDGNTIDLTKYFRQAGDVHLASATSANGTDIYFPTLAANGESSGAYRKATVNDKNVNYIDFLSMLPQREQRRYSILRMFPQSRLTVLTQTRESFVFHLFVTAVIRLSAVRATARQRLLPVQP